MRLILIMLIVLMPAGAMLAQGIEPTRFVYITDVEASWSEDAAVITLTLYGNHQESPRDSMCDTDRSKSLLVDAEGVRMKVEDAEGRACVVENITMGDLATDSKDSPLSVAIFTFLADDGGAPRLPIRGWLSCRVHETPPTCTQVDEHIVHMMRFQVNSKSSGAVTNYSDHYMGVSQTKD